MTYMNQHPTSISTVQLSPFAEEQWSRIVTYSPIYVHWTDMVLMSQPQRVHKNSSGKLNVIDPIDMNAVKLEDELFLNEIQHIKQTAAHSSKIKDGNPAVKVINDVQDQRDGSFVVDDYQASSNFSHELRTPYKHYCSYAETSFADGQSKSRRPITVNSVYIFTVTLINIIFDFLRHLYNICSKSIVLSLSKYDMTKNRLIQLNQLRDLIKS